MNPAKVVRNKVRSLTDLPNIGKAMAADLNRLGIHSPDQLKGGDPYALYGQLCSVAGQRQDPCMIDVFISVTRFMDGGEARPWWKFTDERKRTLQGRDRDTNQR